MSQSDELGTAGRGSGHAARTSASIVSGQPADPIASLIVKAMGLMTGVELLVASVEVVVAVVEPGSVGG